MARPGPQYACRFCLHLQNDHNGVEGCPHCRCMATVGEASPRTVGEFEARPLPVGRYASGYEPVVAKPPLGVIPKRLWDEQRLGALDGAIERYKRADMPVPTEWTEEYNTLVADLHRL